MNCCGESRQPAEDKQIHAEPTPFLVNQQPAAHPDAQFRSNSFTPPNISPPPAAFNGIGNGYDHKQQMTQAWASTHSSSFGSPSASSSPAIPPASYTPLLDPNVIRPNPVHAIPNPRRHLWMKARCLLSGTTFSGVVCTLTPG